MKNSQAPLKILILTSFREARIFSFHQVIGNNFKPKTHFWVH